MPEPPSPALTVYQLRVVLRCVSPLIWRRLLVRSDSTIADLHRTLQVAFGWSDEHLHRFVIHGRLYGTDSVFDSRRVRLGDLGLRLRERFVYEYDFIDGWEHDVRLEQILPLDRRRFPECIGGRRAAPPEDCIPRAQAAPLDVPHRQPHVGADVAAARRQRRQWW